MKADYCLKSTAVFTSKSEETIDGCVIVKSDKIIDVVPKGEEYNYIDNKTKVIDFGNSLIMPGFIDGHTHFFSGAIANSEFVCEDIALSKSEDECATMMYNYYKAHPYLKRLRGRGWFITNWGNSPLPTKKSLDALLPNIPVYLQAADCHSFWLNSAALKECGISPNMEVESGYVGKLENDELSGLLVELEAMEPAMKMYNEFTEEESHQIYKDFLKKAASFGITALSEMMPEEYSSENREKYRTLKNIEKLGELSLRLHIFPKLFDMEDYTTFKELQAEFNSDYIKFSGVKGFIDGVAETYTALLAEPYSDRPDTCGVGVPVKPQKDINSFVIKANSEGIPVRIHSIGDKAVEMALNAFEESVKINGKGLANTIEHIESIDPSQIKRFKELGVIPSMQPIHIILDADGKIAKVGNERIKYEWVTKSLLEATGVLALGTDYPVVDINPFDNIYASVERKFFDGSEASHNPEEKLTMAQTLMGYTIYSAKAYSRENEIGSLEKGKLADIIVIDKNLLNIPSNEIRTCNVVMTMVGGKIVFSNYE